MRSTGTTLVELAMALALLAILLALAAPSLGQARGHFALAAAVRELRADLARARSRAVLDGATAWVELDTLDAGWRLVDGAGRVVRERPLGAGLLLRTTATRQRIPFTARGTSSLYATVWIGAANDPAAGWRGVRVAPTGAVYAP